MRFCHYRTLLISSALLLSVLIIALHRSTDKDSMLQVPIVFMGSQMLAPYQYNYNRPETIPTIPASSDISYTVSPEVDSHIVFNTSVFLVGKCVADSIDFQIAGG
jgi:hypothetical protein